MRKFMRTRAAPAPHLDGPAAATDGHANGARAGHSTLSGRRCGSEGSGALWEDSEFPADWRALGVRRGRRAAAVIWLRPHELCTRPRFLGDDEADAEPPDDADCSGDFAARWRLSVGELGDAALCCAAAALALTPRLLRRVVPPQSFRAPYAGAFRFRFWVFGAWREVVVDDRLPTRAGRPLASRCALPDDFTLPLLEKAYAKLHGGYAALRGAGGCAGRALRDLTGGVVQSFAAAPALRVLRAAVPRATLLVCAADAAGAARGLLPGRAYCVTGLARARGAAGGALVRMRAPDGRGAWAGAPGPLSPADRELLAGEFWMPFGDFARAFSRLELVHLGPDEWLAEPALSARRPWRAVLARRRWRPGYNAGGPPRCVGTTGANPQFLVQTPHECHAVVSVTQQEGGRGRRLHAVGFAVYELGAGGAGPRDAPARLRRPHVTHESRAIEVATFLTLPAGRYLLVPHAGRAHVDAAFLLRVLTDRPADVWEVNDDNAIVHDVAAELLREARATPAEPGAGGAGDPDEEVEPVAIRAALRRWWRARPSTELCRALSALAAPAGSGLCARHVPALGALLACWRAAFLRHARARCGPPRASSYRLRALLGAAGVTASNKVLECLVLRFAHGAQLGADAYAVALARLHLAHGRYRDLEAKTKVNPLSLEEMILMTLPS